MNQSPTLPDISDKLADPEGVLGHRLLSANELPKPGDVFADANGLATWEGPNGFRADAFVKPIYRPNLRHSRRCNSAVFSVPARTFNSQLG